jgi:hypothetical protein
LREGEGCGGEGQDEETAQMDLPVRILARSYYGNQHVEVVPDSSANSGRLRERGGADRICCGSGRGSAGRPHRARERCISRTTWFRSAIHGDLRSYRRVRVPGRRAGSLHANNQSAGVERQDRSEYPD